MFTTTTAGYLPYTLNLLSSLEPLGLRDKLVVFALDTESFDDLRARGAHTTRLTAGGIERRAHFKARGFARIVAQKYVVAIDLLEQGRRALFVDSDIVFSRDPIPYLSKRLTDTRADFAIQIEPRTRALNTGFWLARPGEPLVALFTHVRDRLLAQEIAADQGFFNRTLRSGRWPLRAVALDPLQFPTGDVLEDAPCPPEAFVMHFNFTVSDREKLDLMHRHGAILAPELRAMAAGLGLSV